MSVLIMSITGDNNLVTLECTKCGWYVWGTRHGVCVPVFLQPVETEKELIQALNGACLEVRNPQVLTPAGRASLGYAS